MAALQRSAPPKAELTLKPIEVFVRYRADLSAGTPWLLGYGRYLVITVTNSAARLMGTVFEGPDGVRVLVIASATRQEAEAARAWAGADATTLAVRPSWSFPAPHWIAADLAIESSRQRPLITDW